MQALEAGDWTAARAAFEAVLAGGESPAARMGLGDALAWLGDTEAAVQAWQRAYGDFRRERAAERAAVAAISLAITYQASLGNDDAARGWLARLVRDIEPLRGWELVIRAGLEYDDAQAAHAFSREALEIAARHGDRDLELCALCEAGRRAHPDGSDRGGARAAR